MLAGFLGIAFGCQEAGLASIAPTSQAKNLALDVETFNRSDSLFAIQVDEMRQGRTDLNGDGDKFDDVLHVHDLVTGRTTNLALAVRGFRVGGRFVAFQVNEVRQGNTDFNGDGDAVDHVLHLYDADLGTYTNLRLAVTGVFMVVGDTIAFKVLESSQGVDLNGDGDLMDEVLHVHRISTGDTVNTRLAVRGVLVADGIVACTVDESAQDSTDFNGDGDALDHVLHVALISSGTFSNLGYAVRVFFDVPGTFVDFEMSNGLIAFVVEELHQGNTDINQDGDTDDALVHVHDLAASTTTNSGVPVHFPDYAIGVNLVAIVAHEMLAGRQDYNLDGDMDDAILFIHDTINCVTMRQPYALSSFLVDGSLVFASIPEEEQGHTDLNGDGDALDYVLHVYEEATGRMINTGLAAGGRVHTIGSQLAFAVSERAQAGTDFNGDGDANDKVIHLFDLATGVSENLGIAGFVLDSDGSILAFDALEGAGDLNGDGDQLDRVLHFLDLDTELLTNTGLAGSDADFSGSTYGFENGVLPFAVNESQQGSTDLNGDGDTIDGVLHAVRAKP